MSADKMPDWLQEKLVADGTMTRDFITRKAKPRRCHNCHAPTLAAIDDLGLTVHVDPDPVTPAGELAALVAGRATFLRLGTDLVYRDAGSIAYRTADTWRVHAEHRCHTTPLPANPRFTVATKVRDYDTDPIPF